MGDLTCRTGRCPSSGNAPHAEGPGGRERRLLREVTLVTLQTVPITPYHWRGGLAQQCLVLGPLA